MDILWSVDVIVKVVVAVNQLLQLGGELLARHRLIYIWGRSFGIILLTTAPDHDGVWRMCV